MQFRLTFQALECINQNLLIAKLDTNGVKKCSLDFTHSYLTTRKQNTKTESPFSQRETLLSEVTQRSWDHVC